MCSIPFLLYLIRSTFPSLNALLQFFSESLLIQSLPSTFQCPILAPLVSRCTIFIQPFPPINHPLCLKQAHVGLKWSSPFTILFLLQSRFMPVGYKTLAHPPSHFLRPSVARSSSICIKKPCHPAILLLFILISAISLHLALTICSILYPQSSPSDPASTLLAKPSRSMSMPTKSTSTPQ